MRSVGAARARFSLENHRSEQPTQLDLFAAVASVYADCDGQLHNSDLYARVVNLTHMDPSGLDTRIPIGSSGALHSPLKRRVRWIQQSMRQMGILRRIEGRRGIWELSVSAGKDKGGNLLHHALPGIKLVAFSTRLGMAIWGKNTEVFRSLDEPVALILSSPPYPLRNPRAYGGPVVSEYTDFICESLAPLLRNLMPGGSVLLNVGCDVFEPNSPARSVYLERLVIALHDRLGLSKMDTHPWVNYSRPPTPTYWACRQRVQLKASYENLLWFCNDPLRVRSDNRRVLMPHTPRHQRLMESGGEKRTSTYGDGAHRIRPSDFGRITPGRIPGNVIEKGHQCRDTITYRRHAKDLGLPIHGAMQPSYISDFYIRFLTTEDDLVIDHFGGTARTGLSAERLGRRWIVAEWIVQYLRGGAELFRSFDGFWLNPALRTIA